MDWSKVEAALAAALDGAEAGDRLPVFVHVEPATPPDALPALAGTGEVRTGALTPAEVAALTDRPWVRQVRLSERLGLLGSG